MSWRNHPWGVAESLLFFAYVAFFVLMQLFVWGCQFYLWMQQ